MHKLVEKWAIYKKETQPTNRQWKNTELKWWDNISNYIMSKHI